MQSQNIPPDDVDVFAIAFAFAFVFPSKISLSLVQTDISLGAASRVVLVSYFDGVLGL